MGLLTDLRSVNVCAFDTPLSLFDLLLTIVVSVLIGLWLKIPVWFAAVAGVSLGLVVHSLFGIPLSIK
jgi:uncharacterized membrane protein YagU involved in acid resistance